MPFAAGFHATHSPIFTPPARHEYDGHARRQACTGQLASELQPDARLPAERRFMLSPICSLSPLPRHRYTPLSAKIRHAAKIFSDAAFQATNSRTLIYCVSPQATAPHDVTIDYCFDVTTSCHRCSPDARLHADEDLRAATARFIFAAPEYVCRHDRRTFARCRLPPPAPLSRAFATPPPATLLLG
jgi:hypothetical protein